MDNSLLAEARRSLIAYVGARAPVDMRAAFASQPDRFEAFSLRLDDLLLDYSKCAVDAGTIDHLIRLAKAADLETHRDAMLTGQPINTTERRSVLHTALRLPTGASLVVDGIDIVPEIHRVLEAMSVFADELRSGPFTDVVNIGIGGSDLGPAMATQALGPYHDGPRLHFVSNVDAAHMADTLQGLDPQTTFFIVASKTFTTTETMTNAQSARDWVARALGDGAVADHFAAVSTALNKVVAFGIRQSRIFGFWDWVGGRYSLWSAIGLPIMVAIGSPNFRRMLAGAHAVDRHFFEAPLVENLPVLFGLIGYFHRVACGYPSRAVIPYDQRLARLPAYLQQLDMESNGKSVAVDGHPVATVTGPIVWGEPGTNGQHAFFQHLHQGTDVVPVEFLVAAEGHEPELSHHHDLLLANCLAQSEALMAGRTLEEARAKLLASGIGMEEAESIAPHRVFSGNRPSLTILYGRLDPFTLGRLIAVYEHRVFVEARLFGINAFDQWGVELGKELATALLPIVQGRENADGHDGSTQGLVAALHRLRESA